MQKAKKKRENKMQTYRILRDILTIFDSHRWMKTFNKIWNIYSFLIKLYPQNILLCCVSYKRKRSCNKSIGMCMNRMMVVKKGVCVREREKDVWPCEFYVKIGSKCFHFILFNIALFYFFIVLSGHVNNVTKFCRFL